jgi:hypothetical protein
MKRPPTEAYRWKKIAYGIAGVSGLLLAACVSGMPAVTCTAMAELYGRSITNFGGAGLFAIVVALGLPRLLATDRTLPAYLVRNRMLLYYLE